MTRYGYTNAFRTFVEDSRASDREDIAGAYCDLGSRALDAFAAELRAYTDDRGPTVGRYYSPEFAAWISSPDADLATEAGRADLLRMERTHANNAEDPARTTELFATALTVLLLEWQLSRALVDLGRAEADAEVSTMAEPWHFLDNPE